MNAFGGAAPAPPIDLTTMGATAPIGDKRLTDPFPFDATMFPNLEVGTEELAMMHAILEGRVSMLERRLEALENGDR